MRERPEKDRDLRRFAEIIEQPHTALLFSRAFGGVDPEWLKRVEKTQTAVDLITENLVQVVRAESPLRMYAAIGCLVALHYWRPSPQQFTAIVIAALIVHRRFVDGPTEDLDFVYGAESRRLLALLNKDVVLRYSTLKSEETFTVSELRSFPPIISDVLKAYYKSPGLLEVVGSAELKFHSTEEYSVALEFVKSKVLTVDRWYSKFGDATRDEAFSSNAKIETLTSPSKEDELILFLLKPGNITATQREIAEGTGISQSTVQRRLKSPKDDRLKNIVQARSAAMDQWKEHQNRKAKEPWD